MNLNKVRLDPKMAHLKIAPAQYVNEKAILEKSGLYIMEWGKKVLISGGEKALHSLNGRLEESLRKLGINFHVHRFKGECCDENISKIINSFQDTLFLMLQKHE